MAYMMRRLLWTLPIMLGVLTLVFFLIHMIPGDPVELMLGEYALPADRELMRDQLGLNRPIALQYAEYLSKTLTGDLGQSLPNRRAVTAMILERLPATLLLRELAELEAGLLVMGAHKKPILKEFFLGSVTKSILNDSTVPLFLYH